MIKMNVEFSKDVENFIKRQFRICLDGCDYDECLISFELNDYFDGKDQTLVEKLFKEIGDNEVEGELINFYGNDGTFKFKKLEDDYIEGKMIFNDNLEDEDSELKELAKKNKEDYIKKFGEFK